jgi:transcriptional regulator with XRE-family HTH domain
MDEKKCTLLKVWLINKGISQCKIAEDTGLHKNTISNLVRTGNGNKSVKELTRLYLKISKIEFQNLLQHA